MKFASTSLSNRIWIILLLALILSSVTTFLTAMTTGYYYINHLFDDKVETIFSSIENELVLFDQALNLVEEDWNKELTENLPKLARHLEKINNGLIEKDPQSLKKIAKQYGLTDIYLIDKNLIVIASSFKPDIGLDMSKFTPEYTQYLRKLLNKGEIGIDRINVSSETGILKKYAYYSAPGSNFIVNADIGVYDRIHKGGDKAKLVRLLFDFFTKYLKTNNSDIIDVDVYNISEADQWSLFYEGRKLPRDLADRLYQGEDIQFEKNDKLTIFHKTPFSRYDEMGFKVFTKVVIDLSSRSTLLVNALSYTVTTTIILILLIWLLSYLLLQKFLTKRLNNLMQQIEQISVTRQERIRIAGSDEITRIGATINDALDHIEQEEQKKNLFQNLSSTDSLTGTANRRKLDEVLFHEVNRVSRGMGNLCVIMLDVDWFKKYNDEYGHLAGDEVLKNLAIILNQCMQRPSDLVARFGGEEFICIIPGCYASSGKKLAQNMVDEVFKAQMPHLQSPFKQLTISVGCLFIASEQSCTPEQVVQQVDKILYKSKAAGKNQVSFAEYKTEMHGSE